MTHSRMSSSNTEPVDSKISSFILENASDIILVVNDKFKIDYINERTTFKTFGYLKEELVGKSSFHFIHPEDRDKRKRTRACNLQKPNSS